MFLLNYFSPFHAYVLRNNMMLQSKSLFLSILFINIMKNFVKNSIVTNVAMESTLILYYRVVDIGYFCQELVHTIRHVPHHFFESLCFVVPMSGKYMIHFLNSSLASSPNTDFFLRFHSE